eukprot:gene1805-1972_t
MSNWVKKLFGRGGLFYVYALANKSRKKGRSKGSSKLFGSAVEGIFAAFLPTMSRGVSLSNKGSVSHSKVSAK